MKKSILFGLLICLCLALPVFALAEEGEAPAAEAPVVASLTLTTADELVNFRNSLTQKDYAGETVVLAQGIAYPVGAAPLAGTPLPFQGTFDGQGNVVSGFSDNQYGFIGNLGANGTVKRLHVNIDAENIAVANYGAIANECAGLVTECYVSGIMEGGTQAGAVNIGGIAGVLQDDEQNQRARIDNCMMAANILPAEGDQGALVSAFGIANCTDNKRIYACLVTGELDGDSVYGISARGANHQPGEGAYYDNTVTSASAEDQFSTAKTFDELLGTNMYALDGWDRNKWLLVADELPRVSCFFDIPETEEDVDSDRPTHMVRVTGVKLNHGTATLKVDETLQLKATVSPRNATNQRVTWSSADEKIATVNGKGLVTAKGVGTTTITVKTNNGWYTNACEVTVKQKDNTLSLSATSMEMKEGQSATLTATLAGDTKGATISWATSDTNVADIGPADNDWMISIHGGIAGTATITATVTSAGASLSATCKVTIVEDGSSGGGTEPEQVKLNQGSVSMQVGSTAKLKATITPDTATDKSISWGTSDTGVATVNGDGTVTAVGPGTCTITAEASNGVYATCKITVSAASSGGGEEETPPEGESANP